MRSGERERIAGPSTSTLNPSERVATLAQPAHTRPHPFCWWPTRGGFQASSHRGPAPRRARSLEGVRTPCGSRKSTQAKSFSRRCFVMRGRRRLARRSRAESSIWPGGRRASSRFAHQLAASLSFADAGGGCSQTGQMSSDFYDLVPALRSLQVDLLSCEPSD